MYHCVNLGAASWAHIAEEAARLMNLPLRMKPLTLETARLAARRPRYCALSPARLAAAGVVMPTWQDARWILLQRSVQKSRVSLTVRTASGKLKDSSFMTKVKTSPFSWQPKQ